MNKGLLLPYTVGRWPDTRIAAAVDLQHQRKAIRVWALARAKNTQKTRTNPGKHAFHTYKSRKHAKNTQKTRIVPRILPQVKIVIVR